MHRITVSSRQSSGHYARTFQMISPTESTIKRIFADFILKNSTKEKNKRGKIEKENRKKRKERKFMCSVCEDPRPTPRFHHPTTPTLPIDRAQRMKTDRTGWNTTYIQYNEKHCIH